MQCIRVCSKVQLVAKDCLVELNQKLILLETTVTITVYHTVKTLVIKNFGGELQQFTKFFCQFSQYP